MYVTDRIISADNVTEGVDIVNLAKRYHVVSLRGIVAIVVLIIMDSF